MTVGAGSTEQSTRKHRPGRIIERPRLIKLLDDADAPVILIVAPAGYGKTTLARQWARRLSGVIWITSTPSHRDVVTFSADVAAGMDALGGDTSRFIGEYLRARSNPQRAARDIARVLATKLRDSPTQWLIIDDYHELAESAVDEMVEILRTQPAPRVVVTSRTRPIWATARDELYGLVHEVSATDLALTHAEAFDVTGGRPDLAPLIHEARGWPAVITLATGLPIGDPPTSIPTMLHDYVGQELFKSAEPQLQEDLLSLALLPDLSARTLSARFGARTSQVVKHARDLGFLSASLELHPLLREFLFMKLEEAPDAVARIRGGVEIALQQEAWEQALRIVLRFGLDDLIAPVFERAFKPLSRTGRLGTLSWFADRTRQATGFPPAAIDVIDADVALRDGRYELARSLSKRAVAALPPNHELAARANLVLGRALFFLGACEEADRAYERALDASLDEPDETESTFGLATTRLFAEIGDAAPAMDRLRQHRGLTPTHLVRHATAELTRRRFSIGLLGPLPIDEALHYLPRVEDPTVRSAFAYTAAHALAQRAEYRRAEELVCTLRSEIETFGLEFAQPFADWTSALIHLGMRRFGDADRCLSRVEAVARDAPLSEHALNARFLRSRLLLQTGDATAALHLLDTVHPAPVFPSWTGEFHAMRGLAWACLGDFDEAEREAAIARTSTVCLEIHLLAAAPAAIRDAVNASKPPQGLFLAARASALWDSLLTTLRSSRELLDRAAGDDALRSDLERLVQGSEDLTLARQARLRPKPVRSPSQLLSPRELEVLGLVAQGFRNREIAGALFIAESTVKVHVRHILEKLGVRTRAEAVAQFERGRR